jgi:AraC-type DNA-binding domain-containing proteins
MEKKITPLNWLSDFKDRMEVESIGNDFILFDNIKIMPAFKYPFKVDVTTAMLCLQGSLKGSFNMKSYTLQAPCFNIILADQILQYEHISNDFKALFLVLSKRFSDSLFVNMEDRLPLYLSVKDNPYVPLNAESMEVMKTYYEMFRRIVKQKDNPNRLEIVKHLTLAFFYMTGSQLHMLPKENKKSKQEILLDSFLDFVQKHYKEERGVNFYAEKLCLTPKYLSTVIRKTSGKSAAEWIDEYVLLEAKALLKSTKMTILQISDELNFPSQSFFGKYFKRLAGVSPKEYREA